MLIDGHVYVAEDVGGVVKGSVIDIYSREPHYESCDAEIYIKEK